MPCPNRKCTLFVVARAIFSRLKDQVLRNTCSRSGLSGNIRRPNRTASAAARGSPNAHYRLGRAIVDRGIFVREISLHEFQVLPRFSPFLLPDQQLPQIDMRLEIVRVARKSIPASQRRLRSKSPARNSISPRCAYSAAAACGIGCDQPPLQVFGFAASGKNPHVEHPQRFQGRDVLGLAVQNARKFLSGFFIVAESPVGFGNGPRQLLLRSDRWPARHQRNGKPSDNWNARVRRARERWRWLA